ncbi:hypothetical protein [Actomonas aquatica]|uniref:Uncharacterized protein n=1 Tax=Actomonas aquatica TaxID=2866162 RepID=A0ABZ1C3N4_9BACT|nr:hypothetical protein [Opitutus sp. WL0086]WRQ86164.1 hypothetical protein K1X11_015220 [Opitutus sp. WL0086]
MSEIQGTVVKKPFALGSKSERDALVLVTGQQEYLMRRPAGLAFGIDPELAPLVGKTVRARGTLLAGHTLQVHEWDEVPPAASDTAAP